MMAEEEVVAAVIQLQSGADVAANMSKVRDLCAVAAGRGANLVVLPENFAYFGPETEKHKICESLDEGGPILETLSGLCERHSLALVAGGMPERSPEAKRPYNTSVCLDESGRVVARYRKLHLFDVQLPDGSELRESAGTSAGDDVVVASLAGFRVGLSICYDLRFPELYGALSSRGAEILTVPAAFTEQTGKAHWEVLLRARAIETQSWLLAAAQWGKHPLERSSFGSSMIVNPWGAVVARCSDREEVAVAVLDRALMDQVRERIPCAWHKRAL